MGQAAPLRMPKLGLTMTEGVLASWAVAVGDKVRAGDQLFAVETDKIMTEVEAQADGEILSLDAAEGEVFAVGAVLGTWTGPGLEIDMAANSDAAPAPAKLEALPPRMQGARIVATPLARRLARNGGIDLAGITGSGANGRIKARDLQAGRVPAATTPRATAATSRTPVPQLRRVIARRMAEAKHTIPHFYVMSTADLTPANALRQQLNGGAGTKLSITHILMAALARAVADVPDANEVWDDDALVRYGTVDIGLAVATPRGLLAPLVLDLAGRTLDEVATSVDAVVGRARLGQLGQDDLAGGALSLSNVGMFGATGLIPIVNPGQSAILGVGAAEGVFRSDERGQPRLVQELRLSLSCDHRVWDGARAAQFLDRVRQLIESPAALMRP